MNQLVTLKIQERGPSETSGQTYCPCRPQNSEGHHINDKLFSVQDIRHVELFTLTSAVVEVEWTAS